MRIGELARRAGASTRSLRYYEQQGLLRAARDPNGWRVYDEAEVGLVREIRALLADGFGLEEIRPLVECLRDGPGPRLSCPGAAQVYARKLAELDAAIDGLTALRDRVAADLAAIQREETPAC